MSVPALGLLGGVTEHGGWGIRAHFRAASLTARIRYFAGFAKLERLAIREAYRGRGYGHALLQFMLRLCEEKGYREFYLHAQKRLEPFYERYGFRRVTGQKQRARRPSSPPASRAPS